MDQPDTDIEPFAGLDVEIGPIAYGCWRFAASGADDADLDAAIDKIETALECGMTLIDTADIYGYPDPGFGAAEELLGKVLKEVPTLRSRMVIATKGGIFPPLPYDSSSEYLIQACEASLYRLGVDVIDLYQVHRPDVLTHPAEVADALSELRAAGKVREIGVSNYSTAQTIALQSFLDFPLVSTQPEFHPLHLAPLDDGTLDLAMETALTPLAWSPLAGGRLTGEPVGKKATEVAAVCDRIAAENDVTRTAVLLAWLLHHPAGIVPIIGTQRLDRIRECATATGVGLSRQQWYEILAAGRGAPLP